MGIHLVIKEGRAFLPWEQQKQRLRGTEGKEYLEAGPRPHRMTLHRELWSPLKVRPSQPASHRNYLHTSFSGPTHTYLRFSRAQPRKCGAGRAQQVFAIHSQAWEVRLQALGALRGPGHDLAMGMGFSEEELESGRLPQMSGELLWAHPTG